MSCRLTTYTPLQSSTPTFGRHSVRISVRLSAAPRLSRAPFVSKQTSTCSFTVEIAIKQDSGIKIFRYVTLCRLVNSYQLILIMYNKYTYMYRVFNLKVDRIIIWVIYLLRFTTCYITQVTCIYSKCWKWCPLISMHLSTRFTMFLATFLSVLSFFNHFRNSTYYWRLPSKFFQETLSTVGVRHRF
jgi:hypothetical protein